MKCNRISFYDEFVCPPGGCSLNCCKGWQVPIDEDTITEYKKMPLKQRLMIHSRITKKDEMYVFRFSEKGCHYWTKDGRCQFQMVDREKYMPLVCRVFPRKQNDYGLFMEESFYLSCPYAARLFLKHRKDMFFKWTEGKLQSGSVTTNDDVYFLSELVRIRQELIGFVKKSITLEGIYGQLLEWGIQAQNACILEKTISSIYNIPPKEMKIDGWTTDQWITGGFYHVRLKKNSPLLYELLTLYFKEMDTLTIAQATIRQKEIITLFYDSNPTYLDFGKTYFEYYLWSSFLEIYDTYSFHRLLAEGIIHSHLLSLLLGLCCLKKKKEQNNSRLSETEMADVIAVYERRGRHNDPILDNNYHVLCQETSKNT